LVLSWFYRIIQSTQPTLRGQCLFGIFLNIFVQKQQTNFIFLGRLVV